MVTAFFPVQLIIVNLLNPIWYVIVPLLLYWFSSVPAFMAWYKGTKVAGFMKKGEFYNESTLREIGDAFYLLLFGIIVFAASNVFLAFIHVNLPFCIAYLVLDLFATSILLVLWLVYNFVERGIELKADSEGIV